MTDLSRKSPLARRREELGITQAELGAAIGKSDQTVSNWESQVYIPRLTPLEYRKLCQVLQWERVEDIPIDFAVDVDESILDEDLD